ncbi:VanZ family protein [Sandaracinus amylolyticus]|uniref:VanZ family protein n=1 Tax=Sandaracinus amylolyticus TaxID=927083 RepID=UPI001F359577|nr:VanZ family protein [Sandaracinus amylolyticus]UJR81188.1 Antibiotic resistance protein VanZ [Sandaracinus amylolyticus]
MSVTPTRIALAWLPAVLYMALIWALSSIALPELPIDHLPLRDKGVHMIEYAVLAFLVAHASLRTWPDRTRARVAAVAVLVTCGWGVLDEIHQAFVPGRATDAIDLLADVVGAIVGSTARLVVSSFRTSQPAEESA